MHATTERFYRRYIRAINEQQADLGEFVHESVRYNDKELTRTEYQRLITDSFVAAPDIFFDVVGLLTDETYVAARIHFQCTPVGPFLGFAATGRSVSFAEHVFYRLQDGKIREVWSLLDRPAVQAQLSADTPKD